MKQSKKATVLHIRDNVDLEEFLKDARQEWRRAHPDLNGIPGRKSQRQDDHNAIQKIAGVSAGISGPSVELWTQTKWVRKVGDSKGQTAPGERTIKKHLKSYIEATPCPIHLIPASIIQDKPLQDQLLHWYAVAIAEATVSDCRPTPDGRMHIPKERLNDLHQKLCRKHIPQLKGRSQINEPDRQAWFDHRWARTRSVPVESRKAASPSSASRKS